MLSFPYVLATMLALIGSIQQKEIDRLAIASNELKQGDTEARVLEVLGEPYARCPHGFGVFSYGTPAWLYGTTIYASRIIDSDSALPNLLPIKFRIFWYDPDDLVIRWDDQGRVASILRPEHVGR